MLSDDDLEFEVVIERDDDWLILRSEFIAAEDPGEIAALLSSLCPVTRLQAAGVPSNLAQSSCVYPEGFALNFRSHLFSFRIWENSWGGSGSDGIVRTSYREIEMRGE